MRAVILLNGPVQNDAFCRRIVKGADTVIAADGGSRHARRMRIRPDLLVGDMDSIDGATLSWMRDRKVPERRFPVRKDETDAELAVRTAREESPGWDELWFLGALGARLDHVLAHFQIARTLADEGVRVWLSDGTAHAVLVTGPDRVELEVAAWQIADYKVSLLPETVLRGVTLEGLQYPLLDAVLHPGKTQGISNKPETGTDRIAVTVQSGNGIWMLYPDCD